MATRSKATARKQPASSEPKAKAKAMAPHEVVLSSNAQNALGVMSWSSFAGDASLQDLCNELEEQTEKVKAGDMRPIEGMLFRQAKVLETMFTSLARRASVNTGQKQFQCNLTLALKAQAQCRATLEALAEVKNPRSVAFVRQTNVTTGPQQVNNAMGRTPERADTIDQGSSPAETGNVTGLAPERGIASPTGAGLFQREPNKLLEADHGKRMDPRAKGTAGRTNQIVESLG